MTTVCLRGAKNWPSRKAPVADPTFVYPYEGSVADDCKTPFNEESCFDFGASAHSLTLESRTTPKPGTCTNRGVATQTTRRRFDESRGPHNSRSSGVHWACASGPARSTLHRRVAV